MAERVESKVHKYITENRVRLEAFFVVYDRLRHRHVTRSQFFRALNVALNNTLLVSREEEEAMFEKYGRSDGTMNYRVFCDNCTKIERNLERTPLKEVWGDDVILDTRRNPLSPQNEKYFMKHLLPNLQHIAREQGLVVKNQFIDFDFNHNGCVTKGQFLRGLPDKFQVACSQRDIALLVERYCLPDAYGTGIDISYHSLHLDISGEDPALTLPDGKMEDGIPDGRTPPKGKDGIQRIPVLSDLERRVRQVSRDRRFQMVPFFEDFDKLRTGFCAPQVFTRVMCTLGLDGLGAELEVLAAIYQTEEHKDRWVNYRAFCNEMQTPPDSIRSVLQDCFDRLRREFTSRGSVGLLGLLHSFRDYDRVGQGTVHVGDFEDAVAGCGLHFSPAEMDALLSHFARSGYIPYVAFVREVRGNLHRLRRNKVIAVFQDVFTAVGTVRMEELLQRFDTRYHPKALDGSMSEDQVIRDVEDGILLGEREATVDDLCDYWGFLSWKLADDQFRYCVENSFRS